MPAGGETRTLGDTVKARFFSDSAIYVLAKAVPALAALALVAILARTATAAEVGAYGIALVSMTIALAVASSPMEQAAIRFGVRTEEVAFASHHLQAASVVGCLAAVAAGLVTWIFLPLEMPRVPISILVAITVAIGTIYLNSQALLQANLRPDRVAIRECIRGTTTLASAGAFAYIGHSSALAFLGAVTLGYTVGAATLIFNPGARASFRASVVYLRQAFGYGAPLVIYWASFQVLNLSDRYFLEAISGIVTAGGYHATYSLASAGFGLVFAPMVQAAHALIFARHREDGMEEAAQLTSNLSGYLFLMLAPVLVLVLLLGRDALQLLYGPGYAEYGGIIGWVAGGIAIWTISSLGNKRLELTGATIRLSAYAAATALLNLLLNLLLIPPYGALGAAVATTVAMAVYPLALVAGGDWPEAWRPSPALLLRGGLCAAGMYLGGAFLMSLVDSMLGRTFLGAGMLGIYLLALVFTGVVPWARIVATFNRS